MHWKTKAKVQNAVALLPPSLSYTTYYWLQRYAGSLRRVNPISKLKAGVETWKRIQSMGYEPSGKVFFEVGTGWVPMVPLSFWLMGAGRIITVDLNPYMKAALVEKSLRYICNHEAEIEAIFGDLLKKSRLERLLKWCAEPAFSMDALLEFCEIEYMSPGDATQTQLATNSVDFHTSFNVLEHIPPDVIKGILQEGDRIVGEDGLFIHRIDYSDHFSHSDTAISAINFLQYSDAEWDQYAGNRYMYMNRLRHDDFLSIFESAGNKILLDSPYIDSPSADLLNAESLSLDEKYRTKSAATLSILNAWIISKNSLEKH